MTQCNMSQNIIYSACIFKYCYLLISIIDSDIVPLMKNTLSVSYEKYLTWEEGIVTKPQAYLQ